MYYRHLEGKYVYLSYWHWRPLCKVSGLLGKIQLKTVLSKVNDSCADGDNVKFELFFAN